MGGFFGITSRNDCMVDVFFGVDYHSHLGTRRGGMAAWDEKIGLQRVIHSIENSPFRTKFEHIFEEMKHFFQVYKNLEGKITSVDEISGAQKAKETIEKCLKKFIEVNGEEPKN